ncbi:M24 family metallopeptidase [Bradyrhizobium sp. IC3069]|uniref:M24 family metallopeptidase n=1 Tax=unclassified Bradyrhizobium TaxID=2631580 RepID=UPI001CD6F9D9|nr:MULTISPECIES: Xaa-Pro peptidase family protein [unclassified Bradyrhizobium]MCA1360786.1 M24 family metallopeptidase [Bradyrhizobium sp. IC4059]MCA1518416.1 M24 family metallopeptidase [Bradyrhizobium sp. IC3069]
MTTWLVFERREFLARLEATCRQLDEHKLDVALVFSPANQYYLTGYNSEAHYIPQVVIVPADGSQPTLITRAMDAPTATLTCYLDTAHVIALPESFVGICEKDGFNFICDHLKSMGFASRRIGVEMSAGTFSAASWEKVKRLLPNAAFRDFSGVITRLRLIKSPAEIAYMRQAAAIADEAMRAVVDTIGPGVRQRDAGAALVAALVRGTDEFGGDRIPLPKVAAGKQRVRAPHLTWTDGVYNLGDPVNIELGASRCRYIAALSRSVSVGKPSPALKNIHAIVLEGMEEAIEQVRPGNVWGATSDAFQKVIVPRGYTKTSRIGYSIGIDWLEPTASLQQEDTTTFVPNMTMHMICGMWEEKDIGYVLSETFLVTENGAERLAKTPRALFVKE